MSISGKGRIFTQAHKDKIGLAHKNKIVSQKTRLKLSEKNKGKPNYKLRLNCYKSIVVIDINTMKEYVSIIEAARDLNLHPKLLQRWLRTNNFLKTSLRYKDKINTFVREKTNNCKKVYQFDKNNNFINEFNSITEASKNVNILKTAISNNLKNRCKTAGGFIWKTKKN